MPDKTYRLAAGSSLARWLLAERALPLGVRAQLHWDRFWFDRNLASAKVLSPAQPLSAPPVLIMGMWRCGTSLLHEWLSTLPGFATPRTWQCMAPSSFVVTGAPATSIRIPRPMDALEVSSFSPQEDEFALLAMGVASAYRGFLQPSRMVEGREALSPDYWTANPAWLTEWLWFLSAVEQQSNARLVLKAPNHTFRAPAIAQALPASTWIWLLREPDAVWRSNWHMWRRMSQAYSGELPDDDALAALLGTAFERYLEVLTWAAEYRPVKMAFLDYPRLADGPDKVLADLRAQGADLPNWCGGTPLRFAEETLPDTVAHSPVALQPVFARIRRLHQMLLS